MGMCYLGGHPDYRGAQRVRRTVTAIGQPATTAPSPPSHQRRALGFGRPLDGLGPGDRPATGQAPDWIIPYGNNSETCLGVETGPVTPPCPKPNNATSGRVQ